MSNELININNDNKGIKFLVHFIVALGTSIIIMASLMFVFDGHSDGRTTKAFWSLGDTLSDKSISGSEYELGKTITKDGSGSYEIVEPTENTLHFEKGGDCDYEYGDPITDENIESLKIPSNCRVSSLSKDEDGNYAIEFENVSGDSLLTFLLDIPLGLFGIDVDTPYSEDYLQGLVETPQSFINIFAMQGNTNSNIPLLWLYTIGEVMAVLGVIKLVSLFKGSYIYIYVTIHDKVSHGTRKGKDVIGKVTKFIPESSDITESSKPAKVKKEKPSKPAKVKEEPKSLFSDDDDE